MSRLLVGRSFSEATTPSGAGDGIRVGLTSLFNDSSEEAKLLAYQLELLKNHLGGVFQTAIYA